MWPQPHIQPWTETAEEAGLETGGPATNGALEIAGMLLPLSMSSPYTHKHPHLTHRHTGTHTSTKAAIQHIHAHPRSHAQNTPLPHIAYLPHAHTHTMHTNAPHAHTRTHNTAQHSKQARNSRMLYTLLRTVSHTPYTHAHTRRQARTCTHWHTHSSTIHMHIHAVTRSASIPLRVPHMHPDTTPLASQAVNTHGITPSHISPARHEILLLLPSSPLPLALFFPPSSPRPSPPPPLPSGPSSSPKKTKTLKPLGGSLHYPEPLHR